MPIFIWSFITYKFGTNDGLTRLIVIAILQRIAPI